MKKHGSSQTHVYDTLVVGAGISGIAAAYRLKKSGILNFRVIEQASEVGGTWRQNTYPGCGCDVPSALYSYSFAPSYEWSHVFAKQPEILNYLKNVTDSFQLRWFIDFDTALESAKFDEQSNLWKVVTNQKTYFAKTVIFATGPITEPTVPQIKGMESFKGAHFHSARWDHSVDLRGKLVAVVGTGASAIQFVPEIQPKVASLTVFQRTAPWVLPKPDLPITDKAKDFLESNPSVQASGRRLVSEALRAINVGLRRPALIKPFELAAKAALKLQVAPELRSKVTPNFTLGCKRILFSNDWYPAIQSSNAQLIDCGLTQIKGNTLIASDGTQTQADVIIWGTGFNVSHPPIGSKVFDTDAKRLSDRWKDSSPEAYLGAAITKVPNAFLMLGPNVLVYDSFVGLAEAQLEYIVSAIQTIKRQRIKRLEIKPSVVGAHNIKVQSALGSTVFNAGGCSSYYLDAHGKNFAAWPWSLSQLKSDLKQVDLKHYDCVYEPLDEHLPNQNAKRGDKKAELETIG